MRMGRAHDAGQSPAIPTKYVSLAQLVERSPEEGEVLSSNLRVDTIMGCSHNLVLQQTVNLSASVIGGSNPSQPTRILATSIININSFVFSLFVPRC